MASDIFPNAGKQSGVLNLYMICHLPKVQRHTLNLWLFRKDRSTHRTDSRKQNRWTKIQQQEMCRQIRCHYLLGTTSSRNSCFSRKVWPVSASKIVRCASQVSDKKQAEKKEEELCRTKIRCHISQIHHQRHLEDRWCLPEVLQHVPLELVYHLQRSLSAEWLQLWKQITITRSKSVTSTEVVVEQFTHVQLWSAVQENVY